MTSAAPPAPFTHRQFLVAYAGLLAGLFPAALDQTIVATALAIAGELRGLDYYSWAVAAYLVSATVSTPLFGKLGDVYGRRVTFQSRPQSPARWSPRSRRCSSRRCRSWWSVWRSPGS